NHGSQQSLAHGHSFLITAGGRQFTGRFAQARPTDRRGKTALRGSGAFIGISGFWAEGEGWLTQSKRVCLPRLTNGQGQRAGGVGRTVPRSRAPRRERPAAQKKFFLLDNGPHLITLCGSTLMHQPNPLRGGGLRSGKSPMPCERRGRSGSTLSR